MTMTLVSTVTVGSGGAASIDFNSIPQTGTDLYVVCSPRSSYSGGSSNTLRLQINGDTGGNYTGRDLRGTGSATSSNTTSSGSNLLLSNAPAGTSTTNTFGNVGIYIPNYTASTTKSISVDSVGENNATAAEQWIVAGLWNSTSAITSLSIYFSGFNMEHYSTASLYTILKGSGGASVS